MDTQHSILTIDIGTSGCRAILFGRDGTIISTAGKPYTYQYDVQNGFAEQDPNEIFECFFEVTKRCSSARKDSPKHVVLGSVLHSLVLLDEKGSPLTPLSIWADRRAMDQCQNLKELYNRNSWYQKTGCPLSPCYPVVRLLWYKEHHPKLYKDFAKAVSIKSYIFFRLFGYYLEDESIASGTGLFNIFARDWDEEILDYLELDKAKLPELVPVEHQLPSLPDVQATRIGIPLYAKWIAGGADGPLAHLGSAGRSSNAASLSIGTSAAVRMLSENPRLSNEELLWSYVLDSKSCVFGFATNNGGNVIDWYVNSFLDNRTGWQEIEKSLESSAFDPNLTFIPYLFGERDMKSRSHVSASFVGLNASHSSYDLLRAVVEGIVFNVVCLLRLLTSCHKTTKIFTSGTLLNSPFVMRLLSYLVNEPIIINRSKVNASLLGAARLVFGTDYDVIDMPYRADTVIVENNPKHSEQHYFGFLAEVYRDKYLKWTQLVTYRNINT
jgi:gluconokinase